MKSTNICPYPGECEFDDFKRTEHHFCSRVICPYAASVRGFLEDKVSFLASIENPTQREIDDLVRYRRLLESG